MWFKIEPLLYSGVMVLLRFQKDWKVTKTVYAPEESLFWRMISIKNVRVHLNHNQTLWYESPYSHNPKGQRFFISITRSSIE